MPLYHFVMWSMTFLLRKSIVVQVTLPRSNFPSLPILFFSPPAVTFHTFRLIRLKWQRMVGVYLFIPETLLKTCGEGILRNIHSGRRKMNLGGSCDNFSRKNPSAYKIVKGNESTSNKKVIIVRSIDCRQESNYEIWCLLVVDIENLVCYKNWIHSFVNRLS